ALLLCSDGLTDLVKSQDILAIAEAHAADPQAVVAELIAKANAEGGKDNVSVVLVEGERYAAGVRGRRPARGERGEPRRSSRGGAQARPGALRRFLRLFAGRAAFLLYGLILGALAFAVFGGGQTPLDHLPARSGVL